MTTILICKYSYHLGTIPFNSFDKLSKYDESYAC